jgi:hypothetical protein
MRWAVVVVVVWAGGAEASRFPPGSNVVDPRNYGAVPNDGLPDTEAFQAAVRDAAHTGHLYEITGDGNPATVETYTIDGPIKSQILRQGVFKWAANWTVLCDDDVVIEVPTNTPAFANPAAPADVFMFASTTNNAPTPASGPGSGNEGYRNTFDGGCTIRIGAGNPGARSAINYTGHNNAAVRGVTLEAPPGQGHAGLWAGRPLNGPALVEGVTIRGFQRCVYDGGVQYEMVYKNLTCEGQTVYGLDVNADVTVIEGLRSVNTVPAVRATSGAAHLVVLGSDFGGGLVTKPALELGATTKVFLRDVSAAGYRSLVKQGATWRDDLGLSQTEWASHPGHNPFEGPVASLRLPEAQSPRPYTSPRPQDWARPTDHGANTLDVLDDSDAIDAAIATGAPILQLVRSNAGGAEGAYRVSRPIQVPCHIRRVELMGSKIATMAAFPQGADVFVLDDNCDWSDVTTIERGWPCGKGGRMIAHRDARTLYIRDMYAACGTTGIEVVKGDLFADNVVPSGLLVGPDARMWATQLNPENLAEVPGGMHVYGTLRALGMKTEGLGDNGQPTITAHAGAQVELLGGNMMPCIGMAAEDVTGPGFVVEDGAEVSLVYKNWCGKTFDLSTWDVQISETRDGETYEVRAEDLPSYNVEGGWGVFMPLYSNQPPAPSCQP